ncbi:Hypothetical predicted protein, partial [Olea europaea subsp. europaea]
KEKPPAGRGKYVDQYFTVNELAPFVGTGTMVTMKKMRKKRSIEKILMRNEKNVTEMMKEI